MPILEGDELTDLRAEIRGVLVETEPDVCDVQRGENVTTDDYGNTTSTPDTQEADVPCSYRVSNGYEKAIAGATAETKLLTVKVPAGTDVQATDSLLVHAKGDDPAFTLQVVTVLKKSNAIKWKVLCTEG